MDQVIHIVVAGAGGGRGSWFTAQLARHAGYRVVALVDRLPEAARAVAEANGLQSAPIYEDTLDALEHVPCDAVLVATPDGEHAQPAVQALARSKWLYVEKPLALTMEDCQSIVQADRAVGGHTMVGLNLRFAPAYRALHQKVAEGAIGRMLTIQADEFYYGGRTYFRRWNRLRRYGGGLWITKAVHDLDMLYWMACALPLRVEAVARLSHYVSRPEAGMQCRDCPIEPTCPDSHLRTIARMSPLSLKIQAIREANGWPPADLCLWNAEKDTFDHGVVQVTFANDVLATYTLNVVAPFTDRSMRIGGSEGALEGNLGSEELRYWQRHIADDVHAVQRLPVYSEEGGHGGADAHLLDDFAALIHGQPSRAVGPAEASVAVAMGLAATQSSDTERAVEMAELVGWSA
jgi:predicted dehydrogenase